MKHHGDKCECGGTMVDLDRKHEELPEEQHLIRCQICGRSNPRKIKNEIYPDLGGRGSHPTPAFGKY